MEVTVVRALTKIATDCPRKLGALKKRCRETLANIHKESEARSEGEPPDTDGNKYMPCLLAACSSGVPRVVMTALDAIVKLMDYGYIRDVEVESDDEEEEDDEAEGREGHNGTVDPQPGVEEADPDGEDSTQARVEGTVETETAAGSGEGEAISAPSRDARSTSSVLSTPSTARKSLGAGSQPRFAPQRMFMDEVVERICDCDLETDGVQLQVIKALVHACTHTTLTVHQASLLTAVKTIYTVHLSTHDPINKNTAKASLQQMLSVVFVRMEAKDKQLKEEAAAAAELEALRKSDPVNYPPPPPVEPEPEPQPEPLPDPTFLIPESIYAEVAHAVQLPELYATVPELSTEEYLARRKRYRRALRGYRRRQWEANTVQPFPSVEHEDAFLLFRALCKLSQRPDHAGSGDGLAVAPTAEEARQMESKAVSLEMLLTIVENSGPGFRGSEKFILAVRHYLCEALLLNSTSSNRTVMKLSLKIFKPMCRDFKAHLKSQIEVCITTVFLRVLESENSTFEHKLQVLDVVTTFIDTPESLLEIFLNYDCDLHAIDLYNRIVNALSKISKGRGMSNADLANNPGLLREESYLRQRGLEGLVNILENLLRCVGTFVSAELHQQGELLDANGQPSEDAASGREASPETNRPVSIDVNGSQGDTLSSSRSEKAEVGLKSPVSVVQEYDRKKKLAGDLGNGFVRFKLSPSKGIAYLVEKGMLQYDPRAVATFLLENCDKLDKTQIGEYLGKEIQYKDGFCVQVLHEYVDMMDFKAMRFDDAIRHYLSGFRLPGEAQKIDRMMEKFSERYCLQNPTVFPSADTAFILAFSIIMLNTDLHNPAIKEERKMTREGFAANNRGIAAGGNLEESFLNEIFDHIRANPISLKEDDTAREKAGEVAASAFPLYFTTGPSVRQKREAFNKEREDIIKNTEALFRLRKKQASAAKAQIIAKTAASSNGDGDGGESKLAGTPPPKVAVALRAECASEGRRDVVRAMFEVAWWPMLGAFSQVLEDVDHPERADGITEDQEAVERDMVTFCIKGCRFGIRLGGLCSRWSGGEGEGAIARETFVNSLAKFTLLDTVKEMRPKSIDCVMALLDIALEDGNFLAESWGLVLRYISQLARLQLFASGLHTDDHFFTSEDDAASALASAGVPSSVGGGIGFTSASLHSVRLGSEAGSVVSRKPSKVGGLFGRVNPTEQARDVERMNAEAVSMAVDPTTIDRVFSNSRNLSTDAIKHFVTQLCAVSNQEVNHSAATFRSKDILGDMSQPRIFSLQKLVEVADFNMDSRGRIVWANIWGVLSQHFSELGAHPNRFVAEYSVDSLKQLALKFVYKEELRDFNFQRLFLCPFESIFVATQHKDIKALVLDCVQNLVQARSAHIRSGWKSILSVVALAAKEKTYGPALPRQAWEIVRRLVDEDMGSLVYDFLDVTKCLVGFLEGSDTDLSLQSLEKLKVCANHLGNGDLNILPPALHGHISTGTSTGASTGTGTGVSPGAVILTGSIQRTTASDDVATDSETDNNSNNKAENAAHELVYLQLWWPLLFGLSESMGDSRPTVRSYALETISEILDKHGSIFSPQTWGLLFRGVVSPVFENAITDTTRPLSSAWPGQEEDPREVAAAAAKAAEEEAAQRAAQREAEEKEKKARKAAASAWTRFLRAAPAPESPPRYPRNRTSASAQRAAALETGWTVTMAEPLLDMCFAVFFKHGEATLPLLPEILALHQRCICQESEVLARIALRSLGRFVTTMHKSFPAASATIIRRQAVSREGEGGVIGKGELEEEGKEEEYTVWDCLTSSLCAIMHDNLPLELLNNPFHIAPETSPFANTVDTDTSISPGWAQTGKLSQEHNDDNYKDTTNAAAATAGAAAAGPQAESESSWGELQDAGDAHDASGDESDDDSDNDSADSANGGDTAEAANAVNADGDGDTAGDTANGNKHEAAMAEPDVVAAVDNTVGGDVVMVSPRDRVSVSENGLGDWVAEPGGAGEGRRPNLRALMTMLVVSLRMQRLVHWVVRKRCLDGLTEENLMDLLAALEAASVTALQFNRHHNLRRALGRVGFMTRGQPVPLCPMLEQEVAGYNLLLRTLVVLSCGMDVDTGEPVEGGAGWPFAQERLVQACKCVVLAYADREEHAMGVELSLPGLDHSALVEEVKETTALATLALRSMMHICEEQVRKNVPWMYGSMTRLVRCNSEVVRHHVQQILIHKMGPAMMPTP